MTPGIPDRPPVVSIIGLGPTGRAIGAALRGTGKGYQILGHDRERANAQAAAAENAVEKAGWNLLDVAEAADVIFLTEPLDQTLDTLARILPHVRAHALVTDTAGLKVPVMRAVQAAARADVSFIGGHPVLRAGGSLAGATWCLMPSPATDDAAIRAMTYLVTAMGAVPFFIDAAEHDALVAGVDQLPALLATLLNALYGTSRSAKDLKRLAGPALGGLSAGSAALADSALPARATFDNADALASWLDQLLPQLHALREVLAGGDAAAVEAWHAGAADALEAWARAGSDLPPEAAAFDALDGQGGMREWLFGRLGRGPAGPDRK